MYSTQLLVLLALLYIFTVTHAKKGKEVDPKECEVCIANLEMIDNLLPKEKKKDKDAIAGAISQHCTKSGAGSTWKANPNLTNPRDVKMCYYFEPIKRAITQPFSTGMPKAKVCKRLMQSNPEICEVKYPIKVEKKEGEEKKEEMLAAQERVTELEAELQVGAQMERRMGPRMGR